MRQCSRPLYFNEYSCNKITYSVFQEAVQLNPIFQGSSPEDTFIEQMALGRIVIWNNKQHIEASSLEGLITHVIEVNVLIYV